MKKGDCCAPQAFSYKKINDVSVVAKFLVPIPMTMPTSLSKTILLAIC